MNLRAPAAILAAAVLAGGCGGDGEAEEIVQETQEKLGEIRSGNLRLDVHVEPEGPESAGPIGFELEGPFELGGDLPKAELEYTQLAAGESASVTLVSTGEEAYVETPTGAVPLTAAQLDDLRATGGGEGGLDLLGLDIASWLDDAESGDGPDVDGQGTDEVTGELDVARAIDDVAEAAREAGADFEALDERARDAIADSVKSSRVEILSGADDRLLRRLRLVLELEGPEDLRPLLGIDGATLTVLFELRDANEPGVATK